MRFVLDDKAEQAVGFVKVALGLESNEEVIKVALGLAKFLAETNLKGHTLCTIDECGGIIRKVTI